MNRGKPILDDLVQTAKNTPIEAVPTVLPHGFADRVRHHVRRLDAEEGQLALMRQCLLAVRWGLAGATVIMFLCVFTNRSAFRDAPMTPSRAVEYQLAKLVLLR